jgi:hypothetical protein
MDYCHSAVVCCLLESIECSTPPSILHHAAGTGTKPSFSLLVAILAVVKVKEGGTSTTLLVLLSGSRFLSSTPSTTQPH